MSKRKLLMSSLSNRVSAPFNVITALPPKKFESTTTVSAGRADHLHLAVDEVDRQEDAFFELFDGVRRVLHINALSAREVVTDGRVAGAESPPRRIGARRLDFSCVFGGGGYVSPLDREAQTAPPHTFQFDAKPTRLPKSSTALNQLARPLAHLLLKLNKD